MKIDLNADLGEGFGNYACGLDEEIVRYISSANIACGFHASDPLVMDKTVRAAKENQVAVGAHPGYPDLVGFGRRNLQVDPAELKAMVQYQIGALYAFCRARQIPLRHVKPHGAMYNMAAKNEKLALAIAEGVRELDDGLILVGLSGSLLLSAARQVGLKTASEVFADRGYRSDGTLVPRGQTGDLITQEDVMIERVIKMVKEGTVVSVDGKEIPVEADTVCLHGDGKQAVLFARRLREELERAGITVAA